MHRKGVALVFILLLISVSVIPSTGFFLRKNHNLNERCISEFHSKSGGVWINFFGQLGENGWYISCVSISFTYTPDVVKIWYYIDDGDWIEYTGVTEPICEDGVYIVCWKYEDEEGNVSDVECKELKIDQTPPETSLELDTYKEGCRWLVKFIFNATDETSGVGGSRVVFYINEGVHELFEIVEFPLEFIIEWSKAYKDVTFKLGCSDNAGNQAFESVNGSDIESFSKSEISIQRFLNVWFLILLTRITLFYKLLEWLI